MPAGRDILLSATRVQGGELVLRDGNSGVVDDSRSRVASHAIDIGLVNRPRIDAWLGTLGIVDGTAVKAKRFGLSVPFAGSSPRRLGRFERRIVGIGNEDIDSLLHRLRG